MTAQVQLGSLGLDRGGHLLVQRALSTLAIGESALVHGTHPDLLMQLRVYARERGLDLDCKNTGQSTSVAALLRMTERAVGRWSAAQRAGGARTVAEHADRRWGVAARGALVEDGAPEFDFTLTARREVWLPDAAKLYAQALAAQWDPQSAIDWSAPIEHPVEVESAVVQLMTYLIENEVAALMIPARFLSRLHPHFREVMQLFAIQIADEARHVEVFTRRALLTQSEPGLSTVGGQSSLKTLVDERDFLRSTLLLSVLGEGTFVDLLRFIEHHAPDPITRSIAQLTARDELRHVAAGLAHVEYIFAHDSHERERAALAIQERHQTLASTAGLNSEVFDSLVLLAAGQFSAHAIEQGFDAVQQLQRKMHEGRVRRLERLGFASTDADALSSLHTRNFM
jgi:hypothetical protein